MRQSHAFSIPLSPVISIAQGSSVNVCRKEGTGKRREGRRQAETEEGRSKGWREEGKRTRREGKEGGESLSPGGQ